MRSSWGSSTPFLALLLVLISLISTCVSAPPKASAAILRSDVGSEEFDIEHGLTKRAQMSHAAIVAAFSDENTVLVRTGETRWASPRNGDKYIASGGFDGCVGIVIASPKGAIVAHYLPQEEGEGALRVPQLKETIEAHLSDLQGGTAFVFSSTTGKPVDVGSSDADSGRVDDKRYKYDFPWQVENVISFLRKDDLVKGFPIKKTSYYNTGHWVMNEDDHTEKIANDEGDTLNTLLVEFPTGEKTAVYFEGRARK